MSLDRLIKLAKKTGDRLIVHDPREGRDIVIMDIDSYEQLFDVGSGQRKHLSERQLLDQINRDIALWRANQEAEFDAEEDGMETEEDDDFNETPSQHRDGLFDSTHPSPWHSTGSILSDQYDIYEGGEEEKDASNAGDDDWYNAPDTRQKREASPGPSIDFFDADERTAQGKAGTGSRLPSSPSLPVPPPGDDTYAIPYREEGEGDWQEEPVPASDEPVFYEEPV